MKKLYSVDKIILISIPILSIIGSVLHFAYDFFNQNYIIGLFCPINESVFEHIKLILTPVTIWWFIVYYFRHLKYIVINKKSWFTGALASVLTGIILMPLLFYFYTRAFNIESIIIDIMIYFVCIICGQLIGLHFYKHSKGINTFIVFFIFVILSVSFIIFTINPPNLPIFIDYSK